MKKLTPEQEFYNATIDAKYGNNKSFADYLKKENQHIMDADQRAMARAAYRKELDKMNKRVDQYLKRYGLTKIRVWTYCQD